MWAPRRESEEIRFRFPLYSKRAADEANGSAIGTQSFNGRGMYCDSWGGYLFEVPLMFENNTPMTIIFRGDADFACGDNTDHYLIATYAMAQTDILKNSSNELAITLAGTLVDTIADTVVAANWRDYAENEVVVCVESGSTITYINGTAVSTSATAFSWDGTMFQQTKMAVGSSVMGFQGWVGTITDVSIINRKLSAEEVAARFAGTNYDWIGTKKCSVWLPLKSIYTATSAYTNNEGSAADPYWGDGSTYFPALLSPSGATFDGANSIITFQSDLVGTGDITFGCMFKATSLGESSVGTLFANGRTFLLATSTNSTIRLTSNNGANYAYASTGLMSSFGRWVPFFVTRTSAGVANFYVKGELSGTADQNSGTPQAGTTNLAIGNNTSRSATWAGSIKYPMLVNSILTPLQIREASMWMLRMVNA